MESADSVLKNMLRPRVLVVGDIMLDRYWFGSVERISPEAPVPVVLVEETTERMGGAGNVALNIRSIGAHCTLMSVIGNDDAGKSLHQQVESNGIEANFVVDEDAPTSIKQRMVSRNQQLLRADFEGKPSVNSVTALRDAMAAAVSDHDVVVLSDYGKGALQQVEEMIAVANSVSVPILVDPKGADFGRYQGASMITPNLKEFELVAGQLADDNAIAVAAQGLIERYNIGAILVTMSERGMRLFSQDGSDLHSPARSREVYDVSGAGDTVIAVMAMCLGAQVKNEDALQIANSAAGVVVSKLGTATASLVELQQAMNRDFGAN